MAGSKKKDTPTTRSEAVRAVRVFGVINLVLGIYMIGGAVGAMGGMNVPGSSAKMVGGIIGITVVFIGWGSAAVSGLGLILLAQWGRWLATMWGRIIVWALPIAFGLSPGGFSKFFSIAFLIIIVICFYGNIVALNLARPEFDLAFEPE